MLQWIAQKWLKAMGWTTAYAPPPNSHGIYIVYPHTSNWDFLMGVLWKFAMNIQPRWVAKHTWFRPPMGWFMRRLGGIGIKRDGNLNNITALSNALLKEKHCWLGMAIEGTRSYKPYIHMGYYHIAQTANIPIGIAFIDYNTKTVGVREYRYVKDNITDELAQLALDYAGIGALYPEKMGQLSVRDKIRK
ncbi:hypothetical protein DTO96_101707 [Ephemeroptericola cinctiostellae]|uniref:Phospholipid/glycerol acyltransferase domain-containing protein n=1 Tax=Ephemeroptericola cinctiostellae TaxID=2268024 RepID=A0A345DC79_9BURK|nr:1-acyl-sn-glycerol-3-phosphate acyltransferase [Ephemeroptericola cinctiostellae]AXF85967.1 hypothetical protein DTO96_101707 [Ephemeroptericola cinctiostellae]